MRIPRRYADARMVTTVAASVIIVLGLTAWGLQFGATPVALAQQTCPTGQRYCPSGAYNGQCRPNTVSCPTGSTTASVDGCATCSCPTGSNGRTQSVCSGVCVENPIGDPCTSANGEAGTKTGDACNPTCTVNAPIPVVLRPTGSQVTSSDLPAINWTQSGAGSLLAVQAQSGSDGTTRKNIFTVDRTGLQVGWHPDPAKLGVDLGAAGGQNLFFGVAKATGIDAALDSLLLLQVRESDGNITDRLRLTAGGNLTVPGNVRGSQLCMGGDCRASWAAAASSSVLLQGTTPGTAQMGNLNVTGVAVAGLFSGSGAALTGLNATNLASGTVADARLSTNVTIQGNVFNTASKLVQLNASTQLPAVSGVNLTNLNASNLASGTVAEARLPSTLLRNPIDGGASNVGPWLTIQGGASILGNIALRLYDAGTADVNGNILEFAHNGGSGPVLGAKIMSMNVGANAASGAKLILQTALNNVGTLNVDQLVLDRDGNVGVGVADPAAKLEVGGDLVTTGAITATGDISTSEDVTARNTYECVNVGTELRCNLRQYWRTADKTSGYVESWTGSAACNTICTRVGLKTCSDIQFNYECPDGTLLQSWQNDEPNEFGVGGLTCVSSREYRATVSGVSCPNQFGTEYKRYRCRCQG